MSLLKVNPVTKASIPVTALYSNTKLLSFLKQYRVVYVKPDAGGQGLGVVRVSRKNGAYVVQTPGRRLVARSEGALLRTLSKTLFYKTYVIQRAIRSVTPDGRPFDIRVHVQRLNGKWLVGGMVGRVGRLGEIVTNRHRGAVPMTIDTLLRHHLHLNQHRVQQVKQRLAKVCIEAAKEMNKGYPYRPELGIDIGLDSKLKPWIYEANITPGIHVFRDLKNQTAYRRIVHYRNLRKGKASSG